MLLTTLEESLFSVRRTTPPDTLADCLRAILNSSAYASSGTQSLAG